MANYGIREAAGTRGGSAPELTCMPSVFSYDCDQRQPAQSGKVHALAGRTQQHRMNPVK